MHLVREKYRVDHSELGKIAFGGLCTSFFSCFFLIYLQVMVTTALCENARTGMTSIIDMYVRCDTCDRVTKEYFAVKTIKKAKVGRLEVRLLIFCDILLFSSPRL